MDSAAKTALLLDSTQLGPSLVSVSTAASIGDMVKAAVGATPTDDDEITQEDKPRSRILAEYLAHGYVISDSAIERALALDQKHGVSTRFTKAITAFDSKYKAIDKAKGVDASYGVTNKAIDGWNTLHSYFEKALSTPTGQKLAALYTQGEKQVLDVHTEARRLADLKGGKADSKAENEKAQGGASLGGHTATSNADKVAATSDLAPLGEKQ